MVRTAITALSAVALAGAAAPAVASGRAANSLPTLSAASTNVSGLTTVRRKGASTANANAGLGLPLFAILGLLVAITVVVVVVADGNSPG